MINWIPLKHPAQLEDIIKLSAQHACVIYKHSPTCSISSMAKYRLEGKWNFEEEDLHTYFVDVIHDRSLSQLIAQTFGIRHESPQLLLIKDGQCIHNASHLDISVSGLRGVLEDSV